MNKLPTNNTKELCSAFLTLNNENEVYAFLRDLLTEPEIKEFGARFNVAVELAKGQSQRKVALKTGVSIATVTRVNQWLRRGMGGYMNVINRMKSRSPLIMLSSKKK
jgi:TrpR-related protein YerC/YecD